MTNSSDIFSHTCRVIWGDQYQTAAAKALGIALSSVVRYANGTRPIPREVFETLSEVLDDQLAIIKNLRPTVDNVRRAYRA